MSKRILVIEDDFIRRTFFEETMAAATDYIWVVVPDVESAKRQLAPRVDIIIVNGDKDAQQKIAFCRAVKNQPWGKNVPVILMSAALKPGQVTPDTLLKLGADDFVPWPVFSGALKRKLEAFFEKSSSAAGASHSNSVQQSAGSRAKPHPQTGVSTRTTSSPESKAQRASEAVQPERLEPAQLPPELAKALGKEPLSKQDFEIIGLERLKKIVALAHSLDSLDYYQILGVERDAQPSVVKKTYYQLARKYHPDRFNRVRHAEFQRMVYSVFKRMTEAYQVLTNPEQRRIYDEQLRIRRAAETLRLKNPAAIKQRVPTAQSAKIRNANAKKFFDLGQKALQEGNLQGAKLNFQLALQQAPNDKTIKQALERVERMLKAGKG